MEAVGERPQRRLVLELEAPGFTVDRQPVVDDVAVGVRKDPGGFERTEGPAFELDQGLDGVPAVDAPGLEDAAMAFRVDLDPARRP
jgi:hypothetical protein